MMKRRREEPGALAAAYSEAARQRPADMPYVFRGSVRLTRYGKKREETNET